MPLRDVPPGAVARVVEIDTSVPGRRERLQAYGLAPGRRVEVVQHAPVTVVRVERIDLALEAVIASAVLVSMAI
jgi:Fe2+ transport system protein FeoA